jgi:formylglycine-generating enzyme
MGKFLSIFIIFILLMSAAVAAQAITIDTVTVGNPGNAPDTRNGPSLGTVPYNYAIGKYETTVGQYTAFLNAVAKTDTYGLYNTNMVVSGGCKIRQLGNPGSYTYIVDANGDGVEDANWVNRPVNLVSWGDAARFCNWLSNGQPSGMQDLSTTEDGSYYLNGATNWDTLMTVTRKPNATWVIPSENEWYKAAYHKNDGVTGHYWNYATRTNNHPSNALINPDPGNNANYYGLYGVNGYTIGGPYWRTEVGEFENSQSPYGTYDQTGNVSEWTEGIYYEAYLDHDFAKVRGGAFDYNVDLINASY